MASRAYPFLRPSTETLSVFSLLIDLTFSWVQGKVNPEQEQGGRLEEVGWDHPGGLWGSRQPWRAFP